MCAHPIFLADSPLAVQCNGVGSRSALAASTNSGSEVEKLWRGGRLSMRTEEGRVGPVTDPLHLTFLGRGGIRMTGGRGRERGRG